MSAKLPTPIGFVKSYPRIIVRPSEPVRNTQEGMIVIPAGPVIGSPEVEEPEDEE